MLANFLAVNFYEVKMDILKHSLSAVALCCCEIYHWNVSGK